MLMDKGPNLLKIGFKNVEWVLFKVEHAPAKVAPQSIMWLAQDYLALCPKQACRPWAWKTRIGLLPQRFPGARWDRSRLLGGSPAGLSSASLGENQTPLWSICSWYFKTERDWGRKGVGLECSIYQPLMSIICPRIEQQQSPRKEDRHLCVQER